MTQTRRQQLVTHLEAGPATVRDLADLLGVRVRVVVDDLEHVRRSLGKALRVEPATCLRCDFEFRDRRRFTKPSRCPECRNERLSWPVLVLERDD
jgi:predicted Zn-ribbon and HTH transcriptional regulator